MMRPRKPTAPAPPKRYCRDCVHAYDHHDKAAAGGFILARCQHYTEGRYCIFLKQAACQHFVAR